MSEKKCPCGNGCMDIQTVEEKTVFKGIALEIQSKKYICPHCGIEAASVEQAAKIQKYLADSYRVKTGLLCGGEIVQRRKASGLTRDQLAVLMNVSMDIIQGWESCVVQTRFEDKSLRNILKEPGSYEVV